MNVLYIGKNFSDDPSGRYYTDGDGSGEEFREEVLKPLFKNLDNVVVNIDENVEGYGSSFLVEAFAGLVKYGYFTKEYVLNKLDVVNSDEDFDFYKNKIIQYIKEAEFNSSSYISTKEDAEKKSLFHGSINKDFVLRLIEGKE